MLKFPKYNNLEDFEKLSIPLSGKIIINNNNNE